MPPPDWFAAVLVLPSALATAGATGDAGKAKAVALADERVQKAIGDNEVKKFVYVPGRILNFVLGK